MRTPQTPVFEPVDATTRRRARRDRPRFVDVPECRYFAVDGTGAPGGEAYVGAFRALYPAAYTLHFALKERGVTSPVGSLEGLYWHPAPDERGPADAGPDWSTWRWRLMLPIPDAATDDEVREAIRAATRKVGADAMAKLHVWKTIEGHSAQILHVGPYGAEGPTLERLHAAIAGAGLRPRGVHHEVYVSDPNRTPPERLKTIIRQPVESTPAPS